MMKGHVNVMVPLELSASPERLMDKGSLSFLHSPNRFSQGAFGNLALWAHGQTQVLPHPSSLPVSWGCKALRCWCSHFLHDSMTPSVKVEKIHPKMDGTLLKSAAGPTCPAPVSSSVKPGLNCPSIPKPTLPSPGHILNGKGLPAPPVLEKKSEDYSNNRKFLNKRLSGNFIFFLSVFLFVLTGHSW